MAHPKWLNSIHHDGSGKYVSKLYPRLGETVSIRLRASHLAPIRRVILRTFPDGEQAFTSMRHARTEPPMQWWEANLIITEPVTHYRFIVDTTEGLWHYSGGGAVLHVPLDSTDFRILSDYHAPGWLEDAVFYQIFPDRFANGDPANDPEPGEHAYRGRSAFTFSWEEQPPADASFPLVFYGGDLGGIESRLDYLADLGVNALYLNPIFHALSNHKYDVADYDHVDPHFGGNEALVSLRQALDRRGMRYLLDIVPNHCGYWHSWFQRALADSKAAEAEFFTFDSHPDDYATWLGVWTLPKLNYRSRELRRRMYDAPDAVFRRWLQPPYSADGWRVDVANMLGRQGPSQFGLEVSRGIREAVKHTSPDAYLMGENFFDASGQLQGDQWDGVMNYGGFTQPLWYWLAGYSQGAHGFDGPLLASHWPGEALAHSWLSRLAVVPWAIARQQYNILDSHDTPRIRTLLGGNDALHRLALVIQMTFPGIPGLYYGDEIGMVDVPLLGSRGCMIWDENRWDRSLQAFYRDVIGLRQKSSALRRGGFQMLQIEKDTIAYQRESEDERLLVVAHRSESARPAARLSVSHAGIRDGTRFVDPVGGAELVVSAGELMLPRMEQGATVLVEVEER